MRIVKNKTYLISLIITLIFVLACCFGFFNTLTITNAYASEQESYVLLEKQELNNINNASAFSGDKKSDDVVFIKGELAESFTLNDFTDIKLIPNANYFLINPKHYDNDGSGNVAGTCTTVAMQMLVGYHNYYSDRRILPSSFLASDYGEVASSPSFYRSRATGQGCQKIGTEDTVYEGIFERTSFAEVVAIGQAIPLVVGGTNAFINEYSSDDVKNDISLTWGVFIAEQARMDIDAGLPVVLGMNLVLEMNMHVVPAYGYAKLDGVDGFLVHYGWKDLATMVWVPASFFGFQVRMSVDHTHSLADTGAIINGYTRELACSECGYKTVDTLYNTNGSTITNVKYPITGGFTVSSSINNYSESTATFTTQSITNIGSNAFANQTQITNVTLPYSITTIGENAFAGCTSLESINIPANVSIIGNGAFKGCNELNITVSNSNINYSAQDNILYNKSKTGIFGSGQVASNIVIPDTVTTILPSAFESNNNIETVIFNNSPNIGDYAFKNCSELNYVYFYADTAPMLGAGAFSNTNAVVYVPYDYNSQFSASFSGYSSTITSKECVVSFVCDGENINPITIHYGETISNLPTPTITGYTFENWYGDELLQGETYQNGDVWSFEENKTLYAKTIPNQYVVTLNPDGGTLSGNSQITATYDEYLTTTATISKAGSVFEGWYDENGVKYIDSDGNGVKVWDKTENTTLVAHWRAESYQIQINDNGSIVWLSENGFSTVSSSITYGAEFNAINLVPIFKASTHGYKEGKIFDHFEYGGNLMNWNWTTVPDLGEDGAVITIIPVWSSESHTIYFNALCDMTVPSITRDYGVNISLPIITRTGYTFVGWADEFDNVVNWGTMPDLTIDSQSNGSTQLYAIWTSNTYYISYVANGGSGTMPQSIHTYDEYKNLNVNTFYKTHYDFLGWSTTSNGGVVYDDCEDVINLTATNNGTITLYAVWRGERFTIIYGNTTFLGKNAEIHIDNYVDLAPSYYEYGTGLQVSRVFPYWRTSSPYDSQLKFLGWYLDDEFTIPATDITNTQTGSVTWYAKWRYDLDNPSRSGTYTINNADPMNQTNYDRLYLGLNRVCETGKTLKEELEAIGIKKLTFNMKIKHWGEGTASVFLYTDSGTVLDSVTFTPGASSENPGEYSNQFTFCLNKLEDTTYLYIRYQASSYTHLLFWTYSHYWYNDLIYTEIAFVVDEDDMNNPNVEFSWHYQDPFN